MTDHTGNVADIYDLRAHEEAGHVLIELPYDPDLGDNEWRCEQCGRNVGVPGWRNYQGSTR
jgi:hypothetical protein